MVRKALLRFEPSGQFDDVGGAIPPEGCLIALSYRRRWQPAHQALAYGRIATRTRGVAVLDEVSGGGVKRGLHNPYGSRPSAPPHSVMGFFTVSLPSKAGMGSGRDRLLPNLASFGPNAGFVAKGITIAKVQLHLQRLRHSLPAPEW
jgi:hypothetical protein